MTPQEFLQEMKNLIPWVKTIHRDTNISGWVCTSADRVRWDLYSWEYVGLTPIEFHTVKISHLLLDIGEDEWNVFAYHIDGYKIMKNGEALTKDKPPKYFPQKRKKLRGNPLTAKRIEERCKKCNAKLVVSEYEMIFWCTDKDCDYGEKR